MKPYAIRKEPRGSVCMTSNCPTRKRALRRDKKAARRAAKPSTKSL